jgi:HAE1 family hydrophobic/amphiphilic exporter-1
MKARIPTLLLSVIVMAGGLFSLTRLQIEFLPDIDFPLVTATVPYPGATPEEVLRDVSEPMETAVDGLGLEALTKVRTVSVQGFAVLLTEFKFGSDMPAAAAAISQAFSQLEMPEGAGPIGVVRANPDEFPILQLSVLGPGDVDELNALVSTEILPRLTDLEGVLEVDVPVELRAGGGLTRTNGQPSVSITVVKEPDANTVAVVHAVLDELESAKTAFPPGVEFVTISNDAPQITASIETLTREVMLGAVLAILVIFVFLLSPRPTFVTSVSIPMSLLAGLVIMNWQGMSLNIITLGGLAIAAGRVVDDSIVVMENIYRHIQMGEDRISATITATREVAVPITVSTLTTIAVFAPLGFIGGIIGTFFQPFALTITYALLASLVIALTVIPVIGSLLITRRTGTTNEAEVDSRLQRIYTPGLRWALSHRAVTLAGSAALFVLSLVLLPFIPLSFLPGFGQNILSVSLATPPGSSMDITIRELDEVEAVLAGLKAEGTVEIYHSQAGGGGLFSAGGGPPGGSLNAANILVDLQEGVDADLLAAQLREDLAGPFRSLLISKAGGGGPQSDLLELTLLGSDYSAVATDAERLRAELSDLPGLINVRHDAAVLLNGTVLTENVPIMRIDGRRAVTITGSITERDTRLANQRVDEAVATVGLTAGVDLDTGGVFQNIDDAFKDMGLAMLIGMTLVYAVMVISQRSLITPLIIVFSVPLASIGALGALFITQRALGLPALMGMLMLIGLVVTNAIVLIAFVNQLRARGLLIHDALIEGGRTRLRPILMTAFTTSFVLVPLAFDSDGGSGIISSELATVIIGGLMTSTFLTLVVVPVIYSLMRRDSKQPPDPQSTEPEAA